MSTPDPKYLMMKTLLLVLGAAGVAACSGPSAARDAGVGDGCVLADGAAHRHALGVSVSGLEGSGLVLQNNGGDSVSVDADGDLAFATCLAAGESYDVTALTQPTNPRQECTVNNGSGVLAGTVADVSVTCVTTYSVSGVVSGLADGNSVVLQLNGADEETVTFVDGEDDFAFASTVRDEATFAVSVVTNPTAPNQQCVVTNGAMGTIAGADYDGVRVVCETEQYIVFGTVNGLLPTESISLQLEGSSVTVDYVDGSDYFEFPDAFDAGTALDPVISGVPGDTSCIVASSPGAVVGVDTLVVNCGALVFLSNAVFRGDEVDGAASTCGSEASNAGLTRPAFTTVSASTPFAAHDRYRQTTLRRYIRPDGAYLAQGFLDFSDGSVAVDLLMEADGSIAPTSVRAWTGANVNGTPSGSDCSSWSSTMGVGTIGNPSATDTHWMTTDTASCSEEHRVYCIQSPFY